MILVQKIISGLDSLQIGSGICRNVFKSYVLPVAHAAGVFCHEQVHMIIILGMTISQKVTLTCFLSVVHTAVCFSSTNLGP